MPKQAYKYTLSCLATNSISSKLQSRHQHTYYLYLECRIKYRVLSITLILTLDIVLLFFFNKGCFFEIGILTKKIEILIFTSGKEKQQCSIFTYMYGMISKKQIICQILLRHMLLQQFSCDDYLYEDTKKNKWYQISVSDRCDIISISGKVKKLKLLIGISMERQCF